MSRPKTITLVVAGGTEQLGQEFLQPLLEHGDHPGADQGAPDLPSATDHRHEQVLDADVQAEGGRVHEALQVGVEPAGGTGVEGGDDEITMRAREVSTPMASAITMPPLRARMARPSRESSRFLVVNKAARTKAQTK